MADRYRGTMHAGMNCSLASRIYQHWTGDSSDFCCRYGLVRLVWAEHAPAITGRIAHEKRVKRWRREWKFALIERGKPEWRDFHGQLARRSGTPDQARGDGWGRSAPGHPLPI